MDIVPRGVAGVKLRVGVLIPEYDVNTHVVMPTNRIVLAWGIQVLGVVGMAGLRDRLHFGWPRWNYPCKRQRTHGGLRATYVLCPL